MLPTHSTHSRAEPVQALDLPSVIRVLPAPTSVPVGGSVTVDIWREDVGNYYGIDFRLSYDPALVQVPAGAVTPMWKVFDPINHFIIKNTAADGQVWYAVTNINPAEPFTGTGRVASITFSGLADGTTALHFTYAKGSTRTGVSMYPVTVDGSVEVRVPERYLLWLPLVLRLF